MAVLEFETVPNGSQCWNQVWFIIPVVDATIVVIVVTIRHTQTGRIHFSRESLFILRSHHWHRHASHAHHTKDLRHEYKWHHYYIIAGHNHPIRRRRQKRPMKRRGQ